MPFFHSIGLVCPANKAHADFLQEVTNKTDQQVRFLSAGASPLLLSSYLFSMVSEECDKLPLSLLSPKILHHYVVWFVAWFRLYPA